MTPVGSPYARLGVDIDKIKKGHSQVAKILKASFPRTSGLGRVLLGAGHYAGLVSLGGGVALALHADGVGTKVMVAQAAGKFDTVGIDCVAMNVNDVICIGARPVAFVDYLALKQMDEQLVEEIAEGLAKGGKLAATPIIGGETAIMPDLFTEGDKVFDLAGTVAAVVDEKRIVSGSAIGVGDVMLGVESSGIHSNGYTLVRKVLDEHIRKRLSPRELDRPLLDVLLEPTRIYVKPVLKLLEQVDVHGLAHITGGAFTKLNRLAADRPIGFKLSSMPKPPPIFKLIQRIGRISTREMYRTFNMGIGFCVILPKDEAEEASSIFEKAGMGTHLVGGVGGREGVYLPGIRLD